MNNRILFFVGVICLLSFFSSCDSSNPEPDDETTTDTIPTDSSLFNHGVFVINEGNFNDADGSLTFIGEDGALQNNLFNSINNETLGDVVQSAHAASDKLYIVVNNSNKVEVVSLDSLSSLRTITGLGMPRYMASQDGYGYLTEWVSFTSSGQVKKIDLSTDEVIDSIATGSGAEYALVAKDKLYVSNNWSNTISVIDLNTFQKIKDVEVGDGANYMLVDAGGDVWVGVAGAYQSNDGKLVEIDHQADTVKRAFELNMNFNGKIAINPAGDLIYFTQSNSLYSADLALGEVEKDYTLTEAISVYGIGVSPSGNIYVSDAGTFIENGMVFKFSDTYDLLDSYKVGRIPGAFTFN